MSEKQISYFFMQQNYYFLLLAEFIWIHRDKCWHLLDFIYFFKIYLLYFLICELNLRYTRGTSRIQVVNRAQGLSIQNTYLYYGLLFHNCPYIMYHMKQLILQPSKLTEDGATKLIGYILYYIILYPVIFVRS